MNQSNSTKVLNAFQEAFKVLNGFQEAFENLKYRDRVPVRKKLMESLGWAVSTFYIKKNGDTPIKDSEIPVIESVFKKYGIDAWTGKFIKN